MEIYKEWELLNEKLFNNKSLKKEEIINAITSESRSAIHKIKSALIIKSYWVLGFIFLFTILMFLSRKTPQAVVAAGIINFIYVIGFFFINLVAKSINTDFSGSDNVLQSLQSNARIIKRVFLYEYFVFAFNTPLILLCGMFWARLVTGNTFNTLLRDSRFLASVIVLCIILLPSVYLASKYLNKKAFGPYLNKLNDNINKLQGVEMIKDINKQV
jgi:hypothetical protein